MAYVKQNFVDGNVLHASELNHIEDGIADAALDDLSNVTNATVVGKIGTGAITATKIASNAVSSTYTATIPANSWTKITATGGYYYYADVSGITGVTSEDKPIIDVDSTNFQSTNPLVIQFQQVVDAWSLVYMATTSSTAGSMRFRATDKPDVDIPIKILCIRK